MKRRGEAVLAMTTGLKPRGTVVREGCRAGTTLVRARGPAAPPYRLTMSTVFTINWAKDSATP